MKRQETARSRTGSARSSDIIRSERVARQLHHALRFAASASLAGGCDLVDGDTPQREEVERSPPGGLYAPVREPSSGNDPDPDTLVEQGWEYIGTVPQIEMPEDLESPPPTGDDVEPDEAVATLVLADGSAYQWIGASPVTGAESGAASAVLEDAEDMPLYPEFVLGLAQAVAAGNGDEFLDDLLSRPADPDRAILGGFDDRILFSSSLMENYPYSTIGRVTGFTTLPGPGNAGCSGVMVGPRHVLTVAHCLYNGDGWFSPLYFHPAADGEDVRLPPTLQMSSRWARDRLSLSYDYGIIALENTADPPALGWMGLAWYSTNSAYDNKSATVEGYPVAGQVCEDSPLMSGLCGGYQYYDSCVMSNATNTYVYYDCDAWSGQSGSAVWAYTPSGGGYSPVVYAVHKRANETACGCTIPENPPTHNLGPRLRTFMYDDICNWISLSPSSYGVHACE